MHSIPPNKAPFQLCAVIASPFYTSLPANLLAEHAFKACMFCVQQINILLDKNKLAKFFCLPKVFAKYSFPILKKNPWLLFHKHHRALFARGICCYLDAISNCDYLNISPHKPQTPRSSFLQDPPVQCRGCHLPPGLTLFPLLLKPLS